MKNIKALTPLLDRVLVQRVKAETKTAGGIFLPETAVKELNEAKVLAVGPGAFDKDGKRLPMGVKSGDRVLIPQVRGAKLQTRHGRVKTLTMVTVWWQPHQGRRGRVLDLPGPRVSSISKRNGKARRLTTSQHSCQDQRVNGQRYPKRKTKVYK